MRGREGKEGERRGRGAGGEGEGERRGQGGEGRGRGGGGDGRGGEMEGELEGLWASEGQARALVLPPQQSPELAPQDWGQKNLPVESAEKNGSVIGDRSCLNR